MPIYRKMYPHFPLCIGLVDRDRRCEEEIIALRVLGIETLRVTTIESLYLVPEVLRAGAAYFWADAADVERKTQHLLDAVSQTLLELYEKGKREQRVRYVFNRAKYLRAKERTRDPGAENVDAVRRFFEVDAERARDIVDTAEQDVTQLMNELDAELALCQGDSSRCIRALLGFYKHRPDSHAILQEVFVKVRHCFPRPEVKWKNTIHALMRDRERGEALCKEWRGYAGEEHWDRHAEVADPPVVAPPVAPDSDSPDQHAERERRSKVGQSLYHLVHNRLDAWRRTNGNKPVSVTISIFGKESFMAEAEKRIKEARESMPVDGTDRDMKKWRGTFIRAVSFRGFAQCWSEKKEKEYRDLCKQPPEELIAAFSAFLKSSTGFAWPVEEEILAKPEALNRVASSLGLATGGLVVTHRANFGTPGVVIEQLTAP